MSGIHDRPSARFPPTAVEIQVREHGAAAGRQHESPAGHIHAAVHVPPRHGQCLGLLSSSHIDTSWTRFLAPSFSQARCR